MILIYTTKGGSLFDRLLHCRKPQTEVLCVDDARRCLWQVVEGLLDERQHVVGFGPDRMAAEDTCHVGGCQRCLSGRGRYE